MIASDIMTRNVVTISPDATVTEASLRMRNEGVGALIVLGKEQTPMGIITDRDIVVSLVAEDEDPSEVLVDELMTRKIVDKELISVDESAPVFNILRTLSDNSIRRVPVMDAQSGKLRGIISVDDLVVVIATELTNLASALSIGSA